MTKRIKSALNILAGRQSWPVPGTLRPRNLEDQVFGALVSEGDVVFDVGANYGLTALYFARLAGLRGQIVAFEPVLATYATMCEVIQRDCFEKAAICTLPFGLADSSGSRPIGLPGSESALASLGLAANDESATTSQSAQFVRLDDVVAAGAVRRPSVVKVDVEGAELLVFKGGQEVLRDARPVLHVEVFAPWLRRLGQTPWDVLSFLQRFDYQFWYTCPEGLVQHVPTSATPYPPGFENGYNVIGLNLQRHNAVAARLARLQPGSPNLLPLHPPPMPNA